MQKIFIGIIIAAGITFIILWYRWNQCRKKHGTQPHCVTEPCPFLFAKCNFFTGKPIADVPTPPATEPETSVAGQVDLWCENGKYYKRTTTTVYGKPDMLELTKPEFDALVAQGISYSNCTV